MSEKIIYKQFNLNWTVGNQNDNVSALRYITSCKLLFTNYNRSIISLFVCGHDLSTILMISSSCVIFWSQDTRLCNKAYKIFLCVHIYLHSGPLLAFFSTGQSFEHIQSQCVFERCDVKEKTLMIVLNRWTLCIWWLK